MNKERIIVRQNVLHRAVDLYIADKITPQSIDDLLEYAEKLEAWVLQEITETKPTENKEEACAECGTEKMTKDVKKFSKEKYDKILCFPCQKKEKDKE